MQRKGLATKDGMVFYWVSDQWDAGRRTIFFLHGLTADHTMFDQQFPYFESDYNLVAWDSPGHGQSKPFGEFTMDKAFEIIKAILAESHVETFIAVGQSFGGYVIQAVLSREPNLVTAFVGIGTTPYGSRYYSKSDYFMLRNIGWITKTMPFGWLKKNTAKRVSVTTRGHENMLQMLQPYTKAEYANLLRDYYRAFMQDNQDLDIGCPILITRGEADTVGNVDKYIDAWHEQTGHRLEIIKDAGHNANVDNPKVTNTLIAEFLDASLGTAR
ncbi:alpha/beta hydrolase [bacterium DOLJORAL78_65_58]|nr:MAG: alpha/beta hydrolase [bacterium DOLJORAL78_65_58]